MGKPLWPPMAPEFLLGARSGIQNVPSSLAAICPYPLSATLTIVLLFQSLLSLKH